MELFYSENLLPDNETLLFGSDDSRHLTKVLRKKTGDMICVTNGKGLEWKGEIISIDPRKVTAKKTDIILHENNRASLHISIAPTKSNERMEWFLEKATEIGVSKITPIICQNSERKTIKPDRMKKILISGIKQSNQFYLPELNPIISFKEFIKSNHSEKKLMAHCQKGNKTALHKVKNLDNEIMIMIGPEGDFSDAEIKMAQKYFYTEITLGDQRLRTETAGIVACCKMVTLREISKIL